MGRPPPLARPGAQKKKPSATVALSPLRETIILQAKPQRRNIPMADFAAWFRREDYERIREVMEDSDRLPPSFDEWELLAKSRVAKGEARRHHPEACHARSRYVRCFLQGQKN